MSVFVISGTVDVVQTQEPFSRAEVFEFVDMSSRFQQNQFPALAYHRGLFLWWVIIILYRQLYIFPGNWSVEKHYSYLC